jgi:hypothetical protein
MPLVLRLCGLQGILDAARAAPQPRVAVVDSGVRVEDIARLVGHSGTAVTEKVHRHELQAVLDNGTRVIDALFPLNHPR